MLMLDTERYQVVLGAELRRMRRARGWSRRELVSHLSMSISKQALATWEHGTRAISLARFTELCLVLGERPHAVLERVEDDVMGAPARSNEDTAVRVDLTAVVEGTHPDLWPFRQWAAAMRDQGWSTAITLPAAAVERMAQLCGLTPDRLRAELARDSWTTYSSVTLPRRACQPRAS